MPIRQLVAKISYLVVVSFFSVGVFTCLLSCANSSLLKTVISSCKLTSRGLINFDMKISQTPLKRQYQLLVVLLVNETCLGKGGEGIKLMYSRAINTFPFIVPFLYNYFNSAFPPMRYLHSLKERKLFGHYCNFKFWLSWFFFTFVFCRTWVPWCTVGRFLSAQCFS